MKDARAQSAIEKGLSKIRDPETGLDVLRMGLVRNLNVSDGQVSLVFRPPARIGTEALDLGTRIHNAVRSVDGVRRVAIRVENCDRAGELENLLAERDLAHREDETASPTV